MNKFRKIIALILCVCVVSSLTPFAFAQSAAVSTSDDAYQKTLSLSAKGKNYPYVLVHGMMGWGENTNWQKDSVYWGMHSEKPIAEILRDKGLEVAVPTVAPMGSAWDRACELYAQLVGTVVDYGAAHSKECNHERYGRDYTGKALLGKKGWDLKTPINLVGHSFGGPTCYVFTSMLEYGVKAEKEASPNDCSELFKGGHKGLVYSLTALESPHNGSPVANLLNDGFFTLLIAAFAMNVMGSMENPPVDFMIDQFGITKDPSKGGKAEISLIKCWRMAISKDHSGYDMSLKGSKELYNKFPQAKGTYYFSAPVDGTEKNSLGLYEPINKNIKNPMNMTTMLVAFLTNLPLNGQIPGDDWAPNDGLVPVISGLYPFDQPHAEYKNGASLKKGVWYTLPVVKGGTHGYAISGSVEKLDGIWSDLIARIERI